RQHLTQVSLPLLDDMGPIFVAATRNIPGIEGIADAQRTFGGTARARLVVAKEDGRRVVHVMIRYTSYRVVLGVLPDEIARELFPRLRWLSLRRRAATCPAELDSDPGSPHYLGVWLNPERG
ncbi:MAG: hypothetical protein JWR01_728, partial [Subtercola sp.]|nr:hypothetical protein [Subtercola sp.]